MTLADVIADLRRRAKQFRAEQIHDLVHRDVEHARLCEHKARLLEQVADDYAYRSQQRRVS